MERNPKLGSVGTLPLWLWGGEWLTICVNHVIFGSSASKGVYINRREPQKLGCAWAPPPCSRGVADL